MRRLLAVMVGVLLLAGCAGQVTGSSVSERIDAPDELPWQLRRAGGAVVAVGDGWPWVSHDGGREWDRAVLPAAPGELSFTFSSRTEGVVGVAAQRRHADGTVSGPALVWVTNDGREWKPFELASNAVDGAFPAVFTAVGLLVAGVTTQALEFALAWSADGGSTWERKEVDLGLRSEQSAYPTGAWAVGDRSHLRLSLRGPLDPEQPHHEGWLVPGNPRTGWTVAACPPLVLGVADECAPVLSAGELMARTSEITLDQQGWQAPRVMDRPRRTRRAGARGFDHVVAVPSGGWLAVATEYVPEGMQYAFLLRSDDGRVWKPVAKDPCPRLTDGRPNADFSEPVLAGTRWVVTYYCQDLGGMLEAKVLAADEDAREFRSLDVDIPRDTYVEQPLVVGHHVLAPEVRNGGVQAILVVDPR